MKQTIRRILTFILAFTLLICVLPQPESHAAQTEEYRVTQLVESTYKAALKAVGRQSFRGWCGSAVDWQVQTLGITTKVVGANGNDQYDKYKNSAYSSGGYRIKAYPASSYDLKEALNAISDNGTKNAYNILVGFQKTNTTAGQKYGHVVFIHAILDGIVYFTESFSITIAGKKYAEGKCVAVTIDQFAYHYNRWTILDGGN